MNWIGHVLRHDGLLHEIIEGRMQGNQQDGDEEFKCYMIWQMMVALLHSNGQRRTERYGDTERMSKTCCTAEDYLSMIRD